MPGNVTKINVVSKIGQHWTEKCLHFQSVFNGFTAILAWFVPESNLCKQRAAPNVGDGVYGSFKHSIIYIIIIIIIIIQTTN